MSNASPTATAPAATRPTPCSATAEAAAIETHTISNAFLSHKPAAELLWLIVLNHTLPQNMQQLWDAAHYKLCADGGANRLHDELPAHRAAGATGDAATAREACVPHAIVGDLDSLRDDVRTFYTQRGVTVLDASYDQDTTDLEKCLAFVAREMASEQEEEAARVGGRASRNLVVATGAIGGRLDHTLSNLNSLYCHPHLDVALVGEGNCVRLLRPGTTAISMNNEAEGKYCGVVPLAGSALVSSSGLRWDMDGLELKFSGMLSTCNQVEAPVVTITTDAACLWMTTAKGIE